jgi:hypothetical protein
MKNNSGRDIVRRDTNSTVSQDLNLSAPNRDKVGKPSTMKNNSGRDIVRRDTNSTTPVEVKPYGVNFDNPKNKSFCEHGEACTNTNPAHARRFQHPDVDAGEVLTINERHNFQFIVKSGKPCPDGSSCRKFVLTPSGKKLYRCQHNWRSHHDAAPVQPVQSAPVPTKMIATSAYFPKLASALDNNNNNAAPIPVPKTTGISYAAIVNDAKTMPQVPFVPPVPMMPIADKKPIAKSVVETPINKHRCKYGFKCHSNQCTFYHTSQEQAFFERRKIEPKCGAGIACRDANCPYPAYNHQRCPSGIDCPFRLKCNMFHDGLEDYWFAVFNKQDKIQAEVNAENRVWLAKRNAEYAITEAAIDAIIAEREKRGIDITKYVDEADNEPSDDDPTEVEDIQERVVKSKKAKVQVQVNEPQAVHIETLEEHFRVVKISGTNKATIVGWIKCNFKKHSQKVDILENTFTTVQPEGEEISINSDLHVQHEFAKEKKDRKATKNTKNKKKEKEVTIHINRRVGEYFVANEGGRKNACEILAIISNPKKLGINLSTKTSDDAEVEFEETQIEEAELDTM